MRTSHVLLICATLLILGALAAFVVVPTVFGGIPDPVDQPPVTCTFGGQTYSPGDLFPGEKTFCGADGQHYDAVTGELVPQAPEVSFVPKVVTNETSSITACPGWDTTAGAVNILRPGQSARGDVTVEGVSYYDSGVGEGTTIINLTDHDLTVYGQWGSGCENTTDLQYLVNKDLMNGCGSVCDHARIVTFTGDNKVEELFYYDVISK